MPNINLPLPAELLERIDSACGEVPRVRWIRTALEAKLAMNASPSVARVTTGRTGSAGAAGGLPEDNPAHVSSADSPHPPPRSKPERCDHPSMYKTDGGRCIVCERER